MQCKVGENIVFLNIAGYLIINSFGSCDKYHFKRGSYLPKIVLFASMPFLQSLFKNEENVFYFILKALFVLKVFKFFLDLLVMQKNVLIRKIRLISRFAASQPGKQTMTIHILSNISRCKDNQIIKFGHLIDCNMRNTLLQKSYKK